MRLPKLIYERLPQFWLLVGLLFISSGTYLGSSYDLSPLYFGLGFICCLWSMWVFTRRLNNRPDPEHKQEQSDPAEPVSGDDVP